VGVLLAVCYLGNIVFEIDGSGGSRVKESTDEDTPLKLASRLLGVTPAALEKAFCEKRIKVMEGHVRQTRTEAQAADGRDALARHLYGALFTAVVRYINSALVASKGQGCKNLPSIGLLDIFGFEYFENNSFEQFCINYANEVLQNHFTQVIFEHEMELYQREGIVWSEKDFPDNNAEVELLNGDGKDPLSGIFPMLDEECIINGGTHMTWCRKLDTKFGTNKLFRPIKHRPGNFEVQHFAGPVEYTSEAFLDKNRDELAAGALACMEGSSLDFIRECFENHGRKFGAQIAASSGRATRAEAYSVSSEFRQQLQTLMTSIRATSPHFIRCIKPNPESKPILFNRKSVVEQLRYQGVLHAIKVSRAGFAVRLSHRDALLHYCCLAPRSQNRAPLPDEVSFADVRRLFDGLRESLSGLSEQSIQVGRTLVFFKASAIEVLDKAVRQAREAAAVRLQSFRRAVPAMRSLRAAQRATLRMQCQLRVFIAYRRVRQMRQNKAAVRLQAVYRGHRDRSVVATQLRAVVRVQCWMRRCIKRTRERLLTRELRLKSVLHIQRVWRGMLSRRQTTPLQNAKKTRDRRFKELVQRWRWKKLRRFRGLSSEEASQASRGQVVAANNALLHACDELRREERALKRESADLVEELLATGGSQQHSREQQQSWSIFNLFNVNWLFCCMSERAMCPCGSRNPEYQENTGDIVIEQFLSELDPEHSAPAIPRCDVHQEMARPSVSRRQRPGTSSTPGIATVAHFYPRPRAPLPRAEPKDLSGANFKERLTAIREELAKVRSDKIRMIELEQYSVAQQLKMREAALEQQLEELELEQIPKEDPLAVGKSTICECEPAPEPGPEIGASSGSRSSGSMLPREAIIDELAELRARMSAIEREVSWERPE